MGTQVMWDFDGLTDVERDLLDAILRLGGLVEACGNLGIKPSARTPEASRHAVVVDRSHLPYMSVPS